MPRRRHDGGYDLEDVLYEDEDYEEDDVGVGSLHKRSRSEFIDDAAEEEDEDDDDDCGGGRRGGHRAKRRAGCKFLDIEAAVDSDAEEEEEGDGEDDFIVDAGAELPGEDDVQRMRRRPFHPQEDEQEDFEALEREINERYGKSSYAGYGEETVEVEQQALLPTIKGPKLWMVKCVAGHEREAAFCLMQKSIDKGPELQIRSVTALDHLKGCIYVEAHKEAHVVTACKGLRNIYANRVLLVPIKEMTDLLSVVDSKAIDLARNIWVRLKSGIYKGDLAKIVDVDNAKQKVTVQLIPRIDLQALANYNPEGTGKKAIRPPPRFMNMEEARNMQIRVERKRDPMTGDYYEIIGRLMFKDGFLYKPLSMKSISTHNIQPTFNELEKFGETGHGANRNRKKGQFLPGDAVIVVKGDLKNLKGRVKKVEEKIVHIKPEMEGLPKTVAVNGKELSKYFETGNHVKVVSGTLEGETGMVVKVEGHVLIVFSDTTKEDIRVFAHDVVESSEISSGVTRIRDYELHDLVLLDNMSCGVIIRVDREAFQVLKGVPDRAEVVVVKCREIKLKIDRRSNAIDRFNNTLSVKDVVRVLDGGFQGRQGPVEHIHKGVLFIYDRQCPEHPGFICAKSQSCRLVGGSRSKIADRNAGFFSRFANPRPSRPWRCPRGGHPMDSEGRHNRGAGRRHDSLIGTRIKIRMGVFKGLHGRVVGVNGESVRIELEAQMKVVTVGRNQISESVAAATPFRDSHRFGSGSESSMHPSQTPLHPYMTPMRDIFGATPVHAGMRTPCRRDPEWIPPRGNWEEATSPSRTYEAPAPGGTPYNLLSTPGGQPMTPNSASYLIGTPGGGQPMTPETGEDVMPPIGGEQEGPLFMPGILVQIRRPGEEKTLGVIREVFSDGTYRVSLGSRGRGEAVTVPDAEIHAVVPRKSEKIMVMGGQHRGATAKLIGVDGTDGIVKLDVTLEVKILDLVLLAKLVHP